MTLLGQVHDHDGVLSLVLISISSPVNADVGTLSPVKFLPILSVSVRVQSIAFRSRSEASGQHMALLTVT